MFMKKLFLILSVTLVLLSCQENNEIGRYQYSTTSDGRGITFDTKMGIRYYIEDGELYILDFPKGEFRTKKCKDWSK